MKKLVTIFISIVLFIHCYSQNITESEIKHWIKKCDIAYCIKDSQASFWYQVKSNEKK